MLYNFTNTSSQVLTANQLLSFVRRSRCCPHTTTTNSAKLPCGRYLVMVNVDLNPTATGLIGVRLVKDGVSVDGASATVTGTANYAVNLNFNTVVEVRNRCNINDLQLQVTAGATVTNVTMIAEKIQ